jgi:guanylate kinase
MRPTILAIVGQSGSGKTLMANYLKEKMGIPSIVSFTTRPIRPCETEGVEHHFVGKADMPNRKDMLAHTKFGGEHYWARHDQVPVGGVASYVIDEKGLLTLLEEHDTRYEIIPVLVRRDKEKREAQVGSERVCRDKCRITIEDAFYQGVIENNGSLDSFYQAVSSTIKAIL